jgi:type II restriction/modification system DNA methylase subunit YeeA
MTPDAFIRKWSDSQLRERQGSQEHFIDLCRLLGEPTPAEDDPFGERYCFERGASKVGGGDGWADVWRRGCFGWEYKGRHANLGAALRQLQIYAPDLENPPYLVVSDMDRIEVHTNFTNTVRTAHVLSLDDLRQPAKLDLLRQVFRGSEKLKPGQSPQELTAKVAERFGELGRRLQERGHHPHAVAHFLNRIVFCMFAEDAGLLPKEMFTRLLRGMRDRPDLAKGQFDDLFAKMRSGGFFGPEVVRWFNGGLFDDAPGLPLEKDDLALVHDTASGNDWSQIDPAIFGTLFEAALKAVRRRAALGAHYTDREKIWKIVEPVIVRPLAAEWDEARAGIKAAMEAAAEAEAARRAVLEEGAEALRRDASQARKGETQRRKAIDDAMKRRSAAQAKARGVLDAYLKRLADFRVLDPACGSGNFLYVALHALRDLELRAQIDAERLGLPQQAPRVGLQCLKGIEIEPYAAELARVTLWIGDLQWMLRNGYVAFDEPVLSTLDQIEERDALLTPDGSEADWPQADVIIGNPPFVGDKKMISQMGEDSVNSLRNTYRGRVPGGANLVCFWFEKAWKAIQAGRTERAGLVSTSTIRAGANREVLDPIAEAEAISEAWDDEPWALEGAAVRVSMIGFGRGFVERRLNGQRVASINSNLTAQGKNLTLAKRLNENQNTAFIGNQKGGPFVIGGELARKWLELPQNPNGRPNADVLRPWLHGDDL